MNLKQRVFRLEQKHGGSGSGKPCLVVQAADGESGAEALARALTERGIRRDDLGYAFVWGKNVGFGEREFGRAADGTAFWFQQLDKIQDRNEAIRAPVGEAESGAEIVDKAHD